MQGIPHKHSFVRDGNEERFTDISVERSAGGGKGLVGKVRSGLDNLLVLKSTESSFEGFVRDQYRTLPGEFILLPFLSRRLLTLNDQPSDVSDRIFSTSISLSYEISIPSPLNLTPSLLPDFNALFASSKSTTLEVFSTHNSASVQATLYIMASKIIESNKEIKEVSYKLPNKHYFAVDLSWFKVDGKGISNLSPPEHAEVFMPVDSPSGLIVATVKRGLVPFLPSFLPFLRFSICSVITSFFWYFSDVKL